ncbi:MAG TPA: enolase C-terminal domain-like protein [Chloroflexota bacterium]|nr:enolase C-terminal domain-like protein [Chloroflexota bacterium]
MPAVIERLEVSAYVIPTSQPEADGTIAWDSTTVVIVEAVADGCRGLGLSYASKAAAVLVQEKLESTVTGKPVENVRDCWQAMVNSVRNMGRPGVAATAISAVDIALWDLKARLHELPLYQLLGPRREHVPIYGSGGFTTYSERELIEQLGGWVQQGIPRVKMKIGKDWGACLAEDVARAKAVRHAIGAGPELFVDANGAYSAKQALWVARELAGEGVTYFEEPVSSDRLDQLALIRQSAPMDVAAGEYGYDPWYYRAMLGAQAVDVVQCDVTRCLGITGWLQAADVAYSFGIPFSAHCAPTATTHAACAAPQISHLEYFWDHSRIDGLIFDGAPQPEGGCLRPDSSRPGMGVELKRKEAEQWRVL